MNTCANCLFKCCVIKEGRDLTLLRKRVHLNCIYRFSFYRAVNTRSLCYEIQSANAVQGNNRCLF